MELDRALLIGNSRWHWAERQQTTWRFDHSVPDPDRLGDDGLFWAAVGPVPEQLEHGAQHHRMTLKDIPLAGCPPWLGIDRALGVWQAWQLARSQGDSLEQGLLLADAGTVLSLTLLDNKGRLRGGQLIPGLRLQLQSMGAATSLLPPLEPGAVPKERFPLDTRDAMRQGVVQAMTASVVEARRCSGASLWLCGGDAALLAPELDQRGETVHWHPDLQMRAMVDLMERFSPVRDH